MGYSRSVKTLLTRLHLVEPLYEGKQVTWEVPLGEEHKIAYQIREALRVAKEHPQEFPSLAEASRSYRITVPRPGLIVGQPAMPTPDVKVIINSTTESVAQMDRAIAAGVGLSGPQSAATIIQFIIDQPAGQLPNKLTFPNASLVTSELRKLHSWSDANGWMMFVSDTGITMQQHDEALVAYAFNPDEDVV